MCFLFFLSKHISLMAITKALVASLVLSLLVLDLVQPLQTNQVIAAELVLVGANCRRGQICARGRAGRAARGASVFLLAPRAIWRHVLATPP
ncbi:hypothetical protein RHGRI_013464 [Rhododendron griersonianum]|uniref:Secreted protein n=1 Tax=Rhododendron griersonianum TaxID=479676 RepID=A0AAV6K5W6_9ERIC|nr:hypothetical protein RHGRI_013464 [Rhododendron griersonianum]